MEMPTPVQAHKRLECLAGSWVGDEICHESAWNPTKKKAVGRIEARVALGGFGVISDYTQESNGDESFSGHAVYTYEASRDEYVCHWFDSMGMPASEFRGKLVDDTLELAAQDPQWGHCRLVYDLSKSGEGRHSFHMYHSADGSDWTVTLEAEYRRR